MYTKAAKQTAEFLVKRRHILNITSQSAQFEFIEHHIHNDTYVESQRGKEERKMPKVTDTQQAEQRRKFWEQEEEFESQKLSERATLPMMTQRMERECSPDSDTFLKVHVVEVHADIVSTII
ncbi:uncharacterized protein LOC111872346 isoform X2 [Cryptotermes secundus]|uniref:uncharacterized protein LOC111872346 isoform X2 n=1 Tax=Cryptotermes secundus TaxID=105785 RepID=UPI000CD7C838|nr:uncharacterized protein LOC111872346 isoform X2 [Cryptotermes secundus]